MILVSTSRYPVLLYPARSLPARGGSGPQPPLITLRPVFGPPGDSDIVRSEPGSPVRPLVKPRGALYTVASRRSRAALHRVVTVITVGFTPWRHGDHGSFTPRKPENRLGPADCLSPVLLT